MAKYQAAAHAAPTTIKSQCPLFHKFSECRRKIHGTPNGFGQSASKWINAPQANPNAAAPGS